VFASKYKHNDDGVKKFMDENKAELEQVEID
jgi:hypothetical protein